MSRGFSHPPQGFLSTLKGFKFGFNTNLRAEVLFVNTKEFTVKWGTANAINIPVAGMPGGTDLKIIPFYVAPFLI